MSTQWHDVTKGDLPEMIVDCTCESKSVPVLVVAFGDVVLVATLECWDDCAPKWYDNCSEHWDIDGSVTYWMPLPDMP